MRVADTSALYACFVPGDAHHGLAITALERPEPILVPAEILSEVLGLLEFRHGAPFARRAGAFLRRLPHVEVQPTPDEPWDDLQGSAWDTFAAGGKLSHRDAIVVAWCRKRGLQPFTFDQAIVKELAK